MFGAPDTHDRPGLGPYILAEDGIPGFGGREFYLFKKIFFKNDFSRR